METKAAKMDTIVAYQTWVKSLDDRSLYDEVEARQADDYLDDIWDGARYAAAHAEQQQREASGRYLENEW